MYCGLFYHQFAFSDISKLRSKLSQNRAPDFDFIQNRAPDSESGEIQDRAQHIYKQVTLSALRVLKVA